MNQYLLKSRNWTKTHDINKHMAEEIFHPDIDMSQGKVGSADSKELINTLAVMNTLKWTVILLVVGLFVCK